jgi:hypothetical protein
MLMLYRFFKMFNLNICYVCLLICIINKKFFIIQNIVNCSFLLNVPNNGYSFVLLLMVYIFIMNKNYHYRFLLKFSGNPLIFLKVG